MNGKLWNFCGHLFVGIGMVGVFLPVMPTTPFLLVALFCYSRSSGPLYLWLLNHPVFGPPLVQWQEHGAIAKKAQITASVFIACNFLLLTIFLPVVWWVKLIADLVALTVVIFILTRPSY